jgi:uncharacterized protein YbjT (DUF2867 family)
MIVITAPAGTIGQQVLENVLDSGQPIRVIARKPSRLPSQTRERVEVVQGSHGDIDVVSQAFAGADAVFWLVPPGPPRQKCRGRLRRLHPASLRGNQDCGRPARGRNLCPRPWDGDSRKRRLVSASLAMDDLIASAALSSRTLTMPSFMDNILMQLEPIKTKGVFFSPIDGDRKLAACATRDIASVAAKLLLDRSWSGHGHVAVLGPEDLSFNDMAQIMSEVLGKPMRFQQIPFEAYKSRFIELGMSEAMAQGMTDMAAAKNNGLDNAEPHTPESTTPASFRQWCEEALKPAVMN